MEIDVNLELEDYVRASYWFLFHKWSMKLLLFFAVLLTLVLFYARIADPNRPFFPVLIPAIAVLFMIVSTYLGVRKNMASNRSLREMFHYNFSEIGIDAVAQSSSGHTRWENILSAFETKRSFLLFVSRNQMYVIPKRSFRDAEQVASFRHLLVSHLGPKAELTI
ncbi:MAG: hypothetical protein QOJ64_2655 [Acidobacteriota bacterium]|jgi:hypothetical protein|nr:hypothetical protein [Acidobacteriota bacterium]